MGVVNPRSGPYRTLSSQANGTAFGMATALLALCEARVTLLGKQALNPKTTDAETAMLRGRAQELNDLMMALQDVCAGDSGFTGWPQTVQGPSGTE